MFSSKMLVSNYQYTRHLTIMRQAYYLQFHTYKNLPNYIMPNRETLNRSRFGAIQHLNYCIAPLYTLSSIALVKIGTAVSILKK